MRHKRDLLFNMRGSLVFPLPLPVVPAVLEAAAIPAAALYTYGIQ